ncbi:MAG: hypothetical protein LBJ11_08025 [Oscillospiraceae bacterium]|jgi:hypothetical protein|nr:hypothetical protein [Oscillospiraceae bacterium]
MKHWGRKCLAAILAGLMLTALLSACTPKDQPTGNSEASQTDAASIPEDTIPTDPTEPSGEAEPTASVPSSDVDPSATEPSASVPVTGSSPAATGTGTTAGVTVAPTTQPVTPKTKEEIINYFNKAMQQVKKAKPGYTEQARTVIDDKKVSSTNGFLNTVGPPIINMAKGAWSNWSDPDTHAKGSDHNGVRPKQDLQSAWVKSATCTVSGNTYKIHITLVDERVPKLPEDENSTMHGKVLMCHTKGEIADGAAKLGVNIQKFDALYSGSYIDCTVDKTTGAIKQMNTYVNCQVDLEAKFGFTLPASLPLGSEKMYKFG